MKKLIALIGTLNLSVSAIVPVTSCSAFDSKKDSNDENESNDGTGQLNEEAKTEVQELNIASMLEEGIDVEVVLTTNSTVYEAL